MGWGVKLSKETPQLTSVDVDVLKFCTLEKQMVMMPERIVAMRCRLTPWKCVGEEKSVLSWV